MEMTYFANDFTAWLGAAAAVEHELMAGLARGDTVISTENESNFDRK
jgi:hypothetical protein